MFCARCGRDLGKEQNCGQCGWSVNEIDKFDGLSSGNGYAIASLIIGIISLTACGGVFFVPIVGLVLGIWGRKSESPGMALAGIILNAAVLILDILLILWILLVILFENFC
ncbi:MAG: hypothetical protein LBI05_08795 [Planctomycetaceae bacterium]|jgi:hypothetical protein|nr:hypothetical protein [Planctomycetaceae bacterium]